MSAHSITSRGLPQGTLTPMGALLFAASEPGAWYDPSDLSTLFQDSAGTVPVTAVEQPVGLILDKARPIVTNGDVRMNALPSEAADWAGGNNTVVGNKIIPNTTNGAHGPYKGIPSTGLDYIIKVKVKAAGYSKFYISDASYGRVSAAYDLANGTIISAASNIPHDAAIVYLGDGVYELSVKVNAVTVLAVVITPYPDTGATLNPYYASFAGDGVSGVEVYAVDARLVTQADTLPRYQYTPANTWSRFIGSTHATQATTTKRPVLSRRVNLLTKTEQFDDAVWVKSGLGVGSAPSVTPNAALAPDGTLTADQVTLAIGGSTGSSDWSWLYQNLLRTAGVLEKFTIWFKAATPADVGRVVMLTGGSYAAVTLSADWTKYELPALVPLSVTYSYGVRLRGNETPGAAPVSFHVWGASLTLATDANLPYQWANTATDYDADPAKFPAYLRFDGVDDALQTGNIDFTSTDKMTVWAGINESSPAQAVIVELTGFGLNTGAFSLYALASSLFAFASIGPSPNIAITAVTPELTNYVLTGYSDVAGGICGVRLNGVPTTVALTGSGNHANAGLYIGSRAASSNYLNGRLYSLIVRGAQSSLSQIEATELYIKQKMRMP